MALNWLWNIPFPRFYTALETATQRADAYEAEISKEVHNGRLFRLLTKLNTIVDRHQWVPSISNINNFQWKVYRHVKFP